MIGDHLNYFENVHTKDSCKLKTCIHVLSAGHTVDSTNAASFDVSLVGLKYEWKIILLDKVATTYPTYKMECEVDINLGGITPTTQKF